MTNLKYPTLVALFRTTMTYLSRSGPDAADITNQITLGVVNTPIVNNMN